MIIVRLNCQTQTREAVQTRTHKGARQEKLQHTNITHSTAAAVPPPPSPSPAAKVPTTAPTAAR